VELLWNGQFITYVKPAVHSYFNEMFNNLLRAFWHFWRQMPSEYNLGILHFTPFNIHLYALRNLQRHNLMTRVNKYRHGIWCEGWSLLSPSCFCGNCKLPHRYYISIFSYNNEPLTISSSESHNLMGMSNIVRNWSVARNEQMINFLQCVSIQLKKIILPRIS